MVHQKLPIRPMVEEADDGTTSLAARRQAEWAILAASRRRIRDRFLPEGLSRTLLSLLRRSAVLRALSNEIETPSRFWVGSTILSGRLKH